MAVENVVSYICDRCGRKSSNADFNDGSRCGSSVVAFTGQKGGKSYDGAWGGASYGDEWLLCFACSDDFERVLENFLHGKEVAE